MSSSNEPSDSITPVGYPATWDKEALLDSWLEALKTVAGDSEISIPLKRIRFQVEQEAVYRETMKCWPEMSDSERLNAWKRLLECSVKHAQEILPTCVQCGECCRKGSPTFQLEDLDLLGEGKIPWSQLYVLRRGEPVRSPFEDKLFFLLDERIKLREKPQSQECVFFDGDTDTCTIYADRPVQCRAQACWDPKQATQLAEQPYLARRDIFKGVELLMELIIEHDRRCAFSKLSEAFKRLEDTKGENIGEVLELLAYEDHFRHFLGERLNIPAENLDLVFGRSFADMVGVFGFRIHEEADGSRCLVPDRS